MMRDPQPALWPLKQTLILVAVAVVFRLLFLAMASSSAFLHTPVVDASFFDIWARNLADGRVFQEQAYFKPPFYAYLLSWLYRFGLSLASVQILQLLVGVITSLLTLAIGRLVFSSRVALAGALTTAVLPILPFFEVQLLAEAWTTALSLGSFLLILLVTTGRSQSTKKLLFFAGLLLGTAALGRPNLLLMAAVIAVWLWRWGKQRSSSAQRGITGTVALAIGLLLAVSPATLHNLKYGDFALVSTNLGANLVAGNSDTADGMSAIPVGVLWNDLQLRSRLAGHEGPGESSRFLTREALGWMTKNPVTTLRLLGKKMLLLVSAQEARNNINPRWLAEKDGVFLLQRWWPATWLVMPFALLGLMFWRSGNSGGWLLRWYLLAQAVSVLPFFVNARFRLPLLPVLALFAAAGIALLWEKWKNREPGSRNALLVNLIVLVVLFAVVNIDWFGLQEPRWLARDHFNQGLIQARPYGDRKADPGRAEKYLREAVALDPTDVDLNERLGSMLLEKMPQLLTMATEAEAMGDPTQAAKLFNQADRELAEAEALHEKATEIYPRSFNSWSNLGTCRMWRGDINNFRIRHTLAKGDTLAASRSALQALDLFQGSMQGFQRSLEIDPTQYDLRQNITSVLQAVLRLPQLDPAITNARNNILNANRPPPTSR